ncbi:MAG TPA: hypothetical protein ENO24_05410 [Chloroflexi bacterium]|nr:hypothetical protein [Chloroflexota bacterium]
MLDRFRTHLARFIAGRFTRPHMLIVSCCLWLASTSSDIEEKRRCLHTVLRLDPENEPATLALLLFDLHGPTS